MRKEYNCKAYSFLACPKEYVTYRAGAGSVEDEALFVGLLPGHAKGRLEGSLALVRHVQLARRHQNLIRKEIKKESKQQWDQ